MELRVCETCRAARPGVTVCPVCRGRVSLADEQLLVGETFGKYRLEAVLGAGGMGVVFHAVHTTLRRPVALKVVVPRADDDTFQKRFLREAQVLAELKHPAIVEVYDFDVSPWGLPYYVMEYLHGATLGTLLRSATRPLPREVIATVTADVAAALAFAHRKGVVHRDLKPDNLFVADFDDRTTTKILDFGIAKVLTAEGDTATDLTATGVVVGTPAYLAPEQLLAQPLGPAVDQYAFALIVAEMVSGRKVREGKTLGDIIREEIRRPLPADRLPPDVPERLRATLERATQPEPAARFVDVTAFHAALPLPSRDSGAQQLALALRTLQGVAPSPAQAATATVGTGDASPTVGTDDASPTLAATGTVAASGSIPTARRAPRPWRRAVLVVAIAVSAAAAGLLVARTRVSRSVAVATPAPAGAVLRLLREMPVPPDASALLTIADETLVLQGGGALYLLPANATQSATRVALESGEEVAGGAPGVLWLRRGAQVTKLDPLKQARTPWVAGLAPASRVLVSPSGRFVAAQRSDHLDVCEADGSGACARRFSVAAAPASTVRVGDRYVAIATPNQRVEVYATAGGTRVWSAPLRETQVMDLALLDGAGLLAVGGWFDHVDVHELRDGGRSRSIPRRSMTTTLAWIADAPTLLAGGRGGIDAWTAAGGATAASTAWADDVVAAGDVVASLDARAHTARVFAYGDAGIERRVDLGAPLWAVESVDGGRRLVVGSSDGALHVVDTSRGTTDAIRVHSDGVTDLVSDGTYLASTSDDKSIAVWKLPSLSLVWRSKAHGFLVNQTWLQPEAGALWTASSDGTVKRWSWPQLEEQESLDTRALLGTRHELQALWVSAAGDRVLAGSWSHALVVFRRRAGGWSAQRLPVTSAALYRAAPVPGRDAVLFTGIEPFGVWVYDLARDRLHELESFSHALYAAVPAGEGEVLVLGEGALLSYRFTRGADGRLAYETRARVATEWGSPLSAARLPDGRIAAGTDEGTLLILSPPRLDGAPLGAATLP